MLVLGGAWYGRGMLERTDASYEVGNPVDGRRAQQKLFELSGTTAPYRRNQKWVTVTLFEREINAFFRLSSPSVIKRLREAFADLPDNPDPKTVFLRLRELRNKW